MLYEVIRTPLIKLTTVAYTHRELRNHSFHLTSPQIKLRNSKFESRRVARRLVLHLLPLSGPFLHSLEPGQR
jgi:hypothetical protein